MKNTGFTLLLSVLLLFAVRPALAGDTMAAISDWPEKQKQTAQQMIEKYGEPSGVTPSRLIWDDLNAPWEEMIIFRESVNHDFPIPHQDYLEQAVYYDVPADKMDELAQFDGSVIVYRTEGRLAARCDQEGANFLALNLAHDIISGRKNVNQARQAYAQAVEQMLAGNPPQVMQELAFNPMPADRALSTDIAVIDVRKGQQQQVQ